jgi:hypothetical protein
MAGNVALMRVLRQYRNGATKWHDGQLVHGGHVRTARRAVAFFLLPLREKVA